MENTLDLKKVIRVKFQPSWHPIFNIDKPCIKYVKFVPLKQRQIFNVTIRKKMIGWAAPPTGELIYLQLALWSPIQRFNQAQL